MGLNLPSDGKILFNGNPYKDIKIKFGYVPQKIHLLNESIKNNIAFGIEEKDIDYDRLKTSIELSQLNELVNELENGIESQVGDSGSKLSGGQAKNWNCKSLI